MEARFSQRVKNIVKISRDIAFNLNSDAIKPEHFLLGIINESLLTVKDNGHAVLYLEMMGVDVKNLSDDTYLYLLESDTKKPGSPSVVEKLKSIPLTKLAERVITNSFLEAKSLNNDFIGSEHLLLAYLKINTPFHVEVLGSKYNLNYDRLRKIIFEKPLPEDLISEKRPSNSEQESSEMPSEFVRNQDVYEVISHSAIEIGEIFTSTFPGNVKYYGGGPPSVENSPLSLIFNKEDYSNEEIKDIIGLLSELYSSIGGDYLKIVGMSQFEYKIELA
ncbi:MAG TPA: Clp protease N-terminal domain-containing protein [Mucilaginibacter sp.]|jgi:ATP-dependent Clp protease ATP-binding subunit ClpA|nr:Clp protease N-terminal domain-containing protein [Mucilaginibacter sp.]